MQFAHAKPIYAIVCSLVQTIRERDIKLYKKGQEKVNKKINN